MMIPVARFASVVPLVSARAVARPFTYLADGLEKGAVVSVRFGRATRGGVVVGLEDEAPPDVDPVAVDGVLGAVPGPLVARGTCEGETGFGLFEHPTMGRHAPSGFDDFGSVAP